MAWKDGLYYQRSIRVAGRVTTRYYGRSILGQGAAVVDEDLAAEAAEQRRQAAEARQASHQAAEADRQRGAVVQNLVVIGLEALGFRRYARNPWKRRRPSMTRLALAHSPSDQDQDQDQVAALIAEVRADVPGALGELRQMARDHPELVIRTTYGDVCKIAHTVLVAGFAGGDAALEEGLRARLQGLDRRAGRGFSPKPSPQAMPRSDQLRLARALDDHLHPPRGSDPPRRRPSPADAIAANPRTNHRG